MAPAPTARPDPADPLLEILARVAVSQVRRERDKIRAKDRDEVTTR